MPNERQPSGETLTAPWMCGNCQSSNVWRYSSCRNCNKPRFTFREDCKVEFTQHEERAKVHALATDVRELASVLAKDAHRIAMLCDLAKSLVDRNRELRDSASKSLLVQDDERSKNETLQRECRSYRDMANAKIRQIEELRQDHLDVVARNALVRNVSTAILVALSVLLSYLIFGVA